LLVAERIGEVRDRAVQRGLGNRLAHGHLALRVVRFEVRKRRIVHGGAADRYQRIGRELCDIVPIHRRAARQRCEVDGIARAEIVDRKR
jgi:hypothetical protein